MKNFVTLFLLFVSFTAFSQVVIPDEAQVDPKAALKVYSTNKGVLIPRLTTAQMNAMPSPATGLWIYNSTLNMFYFYDGTWQKMSQTRTDTADPAAKYKGEYYYNTSDGKIHYWDGTSWVIVGTL
jgi:hypothetical protein